VDAAAAAERKTSLGKDWHALCLKCVECNKVLTPGSHAEVCFYLRRWLTRAAAPH